MNAPDKIYLERDKETNKIHHLWGRDAVISSFYEHIEYTRKDALLEWAKKEMGKWSSESTTAQGVKMGLTLVIDKIESL